MEEGMGYTSNRERRVRIQAILMSIYRQWTRVVMSDGTCLLSGAESAESARP